MDFTSNNLFNFRDIGGIKTKDGKTIKEGLFFRSGTLYRVNETDKALLDSLHIKHVVDLRSKGEIESNKDKYLPSGADYISISAITRKMYAKQSLDMTKENSGEERLLDIYELLPFNNDAYKYVFDLIKNNDLPILFHCTAGKDRTGVLSALILMLLGVDNKKIVMDYMNSIPGLIKEYGKSNVPETWLVKEEWITTAINNVYLEYGSVEKYFESEYGYSLKDIEDVRNRYLY